MPTTPAPTQHGGYGGGHPGHTGHPGHPGQPAAGGYGAPAPGGYGGGKLPEKRSQTAFDNRQSFMFMIRFMTAQVMAHPAQALTTKTHWLEAMRRQVMLVEGLMDILTLDGCCFPDAIYVS